MSSDKSIHIVVITSPERMEQDWLQQLAAEDEFDRVDRVSTVRAGLDLVQQTHPDLVIVDREFDQAETCIRQIFMTTPGTICIAIVPQPDVASLRRLVAVGVRDVLVRSFQYNELLGSIQSLLATEAGRRSLALTGGDTRAPRRGRLVVTISPKGGSGTTTVSTNLAVALQQMNHGPVVLADFSLQFGDVGVHLNIWSKYTMHDLLSRVDEIDDAMLAPVVQKHSSGLNVLLSPNSPEAAGEITGEQIDTLLDRLLERYRYVVVDTWSFLDDVVCLLLRRADEVVVVTTPEIPALKNVKHFLEYSRQQGLIEGRTTIVLNRFPSVDKIALPDVEQHLRHSVGANIPSEGRLVTHSVNRGVPVVLSHAQSWVGQSMLKLAGHIAGDKTNTISLTPDKGEVKEQPQNDAKNRRNIFRFARQKA